MAERKVTRREVLAGLVAGGVLVACKAGGEPAVVEGRTPTAPPPTPPPAPPEPAAATTAPEAPKVPAEVGVVTVELVHDTICPWCRIGHHRLAKALAEVGDPNVRVVYRPFLLEPDTPPEGHDMRERLAAKYGAERIEQMFTRVTEVGAADGITFDFAKVRRSPDTTKAHRLVAAAPEAVKTRVLDAIHVAHFERGEDTGDVQVLARLAAEAGWDADAATRALADAGAIAAVRQEARDASARGIRGVPYFTITGPKTAAGAAPQTLSGAQPVAALVAALKAAR